MRISSSRVSLALLATAAIAFGACSTAATAAPTVAPTTAPTAAATPAQTTAATSGPTTAPTTAPTSGATAASSAGAALKIGVVTDVGTVDDKNFNQFSFEGAVAGATDIGAAKPAVVVPNSSNDYATDINGFVSQKYDIIVTVGFNLTNDTIKAAKANPKIWFIGVDQAPLCITATGDADTAASPTCAGDPAKLLPNFVAIKYEEDQAGYLAGIVAASISKVGKVGVIGGINLVPAVVRYIQGYQLGAKSVNPNITVDIGYVTTSDFGKAFNDPATGKQYATQFIQQKGDDVMFQVAGKTGNGVLQAACTAKIVGLGVDVDQYLSLNAATDATYGCILTSAEKHLSNSVEATIKAIVAGTAAGGNVTYDAKTDGIGLAPFTPASGVPADLQAKLDAALAAMKAGTLTTCPAKCGTP